MMEDHLFYNFMQNLKKNPAKRGTSGPRIKPLTFDSFAVEQKHDRLSLEGLAKLAEWSRETLRQRAHILNFLATYHPDSPRYWRKGEDKPSDRDENKQVYLVGLDLEDFMESQSRKKYKKMGMPTFIPDNYELAKIVMKDFKKKHKPGRLVDISYRDTAMWESPDLADVQLMGNFLQKTYVDPYIKDVLKTVNAAGVKFTTNQKKENKIEFVYKTKPKNGKV